RRQPRRRGGHGCGRAAVPALPSQVAVLTKVGISLLTLVPGVVGGSETYARELTRALARVGELEYEAFVPPLAPDAADGLPTRVIREYGAHATTPGRVSAMARAWLAPGRLRRALRLASP